MTLDPADRDAVEAALGREPGPVEAALFENLWSEHCAYRSSRRLLSAFESEAAHVVVGPGDDAAVVEVADGLGVVLGIESHNHPSYVDPYDGAATGVGGIVRDVISMGAYPIALADCLYFGEFGAEHSRYLLEGVVEGIADYGNAIGVPTIAGGLEFHEGYEGNPLVNVGCVGLLPLDRLVTAEARSPGNRLVLVGASTGRDGLGGASFASEALSADAETADRPAVQVGDPYTEKLLIEANEALLDADLVRSARDLGAAGLGGATCEMVGKAGLGAEISLERVHQREPNMTALELLLAESQERMCYEVRPEDVEAVERIAERFELGCSVVGEVTEGNYVCTFEGERVVDVPPDLVTDGAPLYDRERSPPVAPTRDLPEAGLGTSLEAVLTDPSTADASWVFRQYDHEVGARTAVRPGVDAAILALREVDVGLALAAGADPRWTSADPYAGARAVALEVATNLATVGATPLAAVDCLNGGNPEKPDVFGAFAATVDGLADACRSLDVPVVGGNVSLYNDSEAGPVPPTPTLMMVGRRGGYDAPRTTLSGDAALVLVGESAGALGGSAYLEHAGGADAFPALPDDLRPRVDGIAAVAELPTTTAIHDVSHGGLAVTLAELVTTDAGVEVDLDTNADEATAAERLFCEAPGRVVVETSDPTAVTDAAGDVAPVTTVGRSTGEGRLAITVAGETFTYGHETIVEYRDVLARELD